MKKVDKLIQIINESPKKYIDTINAKKDIDILEKILEYLSEEYHGGKKPLVSDEIFDVLRDELETRRPKSNFLLQVGAPVLKGTKEKIKLPFYMGSLDKIKPEHGNLDKWMETYVGPYVWSDKLDGVSALIHNNDGVINMYTRGNGSVGQNITHLLNQTLPKNFDLTTIPPGYAIRGELIISKKKFIKIEGDMKNARNTVAGLVNSKTINMNVLNMTTFVGYGILHPKMKQSKQLKEIKKLGINVVEHKIIKKMDLTILGNILEKRRSESIYDIDGIVVIDDEKNHEHVKNENPKHGFAFKQVFGDQYTQATIIDVEWRPSMDGYLKPRVVISPVELSGVTITYATAFNAKFVVQNILGVGAVIQIIRSGDVVPYIMKVIKPSANGKPLLPNVDYEWSDSGVDIILSDVNCNAFDDVAVKVAAHFFKKLDIKNIDEGIIKKLVDAKYNSILDILSANPDKLIKIDGIGKTLVDKINVNISNGFANADLATFMAASHKFGRGISTKKLKILLKTYPDILKKYKKWDKNLFIDNIVAVDGFDVITAKKIVNNFDVFIKFMDDVHLIYDISHLYKSQKTQNKINTNKKNNFIADKKIVFTGFRPKKELEKYIEDNGGTISTSISKNTSFVVHVPDADKQSSKISTAKKLNIKIMTKDEFYKEINWTD